MDPGAGGGFRGGQSAFFALAADRLKAWVRHQLWMAEDLGGGVTRRAAYHHIRRAKSGTGEGQEPPPELPGCLQHVCDWWSVLGVVYGRRDGLGRVLPSHLAADIEIRFGVCPNMFEINLLQDLFEISLTPVPAAMKEHK